MDAMEQRLLEIEHMADGVTSDGQEIRAQKSSTGDNVDDHKHSATESLQANGRMTKDETDGGVISDSRVQERVLSVQQRLRAAQAGRELLQQELEAVKGERGAALKAVTELEAKVRFSP